ncbi:hypothetical protein CBR_g244 [Chara braunii]|uniref:Uncharacterized protein n=1 Tax=Chara braunii TaxID=69332 RepID=A0A388JM79_CHABU|nr:hypothetical protein CBR_g244 [Chara braunii]|eukprot:GBG58845.1 hypothetical protein CBR_g244 [Chara braunii]
MYTCPRTRRSAEAGGTGRPDNELLHVDRTWNDAQAAQRPLAADLNVASAQKERKGGGGGGEGGGGGRRGGGGGGVGRGDVKTSRWPLRVVGVVVLLVISLVVHPCPCDAVPDGCSGLLASVSASCNVMDVLLQRLSRDSTCCAAVVAANRQFCFCDEELVKSISTVFGISTSIAPKVADVCGVPADEVRIYHVSGCPGKEARLLRQGVEDGTLEPPGRGSPYELGIKIAEKPVSLQDIDDGVTPEEHVAIREEDVQMVTTVFSWRSDNSFILAPPSGNDRKVVTKQSTTDVPLSFRIKQLDVSILDAGNGGKWVEWSNAYVALNFCLFEVVFHWAEPADKDEEDENKRGRGAVGDFVRQAGHRRDQSHLVGSDRPKSGGGRRSRRRGGREEREEVSEQDEEENSGAESDDPNYHESEEGELEESESGESESSNERSKEEDEAATQKRRERAEGKRPVEESDGPAVRLLQGDPTRNPEPPQEEPGEDGITNAEGSGSRRRRSSSPARCSPPPRPTVRIRGDAGVGASSPVIIPLSP